MCENIQNCCRICLDVESKHVPILGDNSIHLHMKSCLAITVCANDQLPKVICVSCVSLLSDFYNFQLNARCSQDWLESSLQGKSKKSSETKIHIQPLPDSEYNSDSLLEFLNNTANIEEYLNNLGKEDIPSIVNMFSKNHENSMDGVSKATNNVKITKQPSPKKKDTAEMEIDVLDSDEDIVQEILMKETPKKTTRSKTEKSHSCFGCKVKFDNLEKLSQHLGICDLALRTCSHCNMLFDSKQKMQTHYITHSTQFICNCGKQFTSKEKLLQHHKICHFDHGASMGCFYRCKQCKETFKDRFQLYKHAREHVMKAEERSCDICGHKFIGAAVLAKHRKEVHKLPECLLYRCKICSFTLPNYKQLYMHVQKHTENPKPERHLCETCGRCFSTRNSLIRHVTQHESGSHKCSVCKKSFSDAKSRDEHVLEHDEMVICEKCGQNVSSCELELHTCK